MSKMRYTLTSMYRLGIIRFAKDYFEFLQNMRLIKNQQQRAMEEGGGDGFAFGEPWAILTDKYADSGIAQGAYFHQDLLVARRIFENNPQKHIDIGSRIDGFVAHVASFREILVMDIRPLQNTVKNIVFVQQDFMAVIDSEMLESYDSVSCLHALEHFGLGRYGDPINYNGHLVGLENLYRLLKHGGKLYFSVPIGLPQRIEFHAHRIFNLEYLLKQFEGKYTIDRFSYVDDSGDFHENTPLIRTDITNNYGCKGDGVQGCAIFEMTKL